FDIWALVAQGMFSSAMNTILIWKLSSWRPAFVFSGESFRKLFEFGGFLFLSGMLDTAYNRFYTLVIGRWYGAYELGIYNRADSTKQVPTTVLTGVLARVAFPLFSQANDDPARLKRGLQMSIQGI